MASAPGERYGSVDRMSCIWWAPRTSVDRVSAPGGVRCRGANFTAGSGRSRTGRYGTAADDDAAEHEMPLDIPRADSGGRGCPGRLSVLVRLRASASTVVYDGSCRTGETGGGGSCLLLQGRVGVAIRPYNAGAVPRGSARVSRPTIAWSRAATAGNKATVLYRPKLSCCRGGA